MRDSLTSSELSALLPYLSGPERAELDALLAPTQDPKEWVESCLWIRAKSRSVIPFRLNAIQRDYLQHRSRADVVLKSRQVGISTLVCGLFLADCLLHPNTTSVLVAHDLDSTEMIFRIVQLFWERLPAPEKARVGEPRYQSRREFHWPKLGSSFLVGTAGSLRFGRGRTVHAVHCSEFAFWPKPEETLAALLEAVPADGRVVIESTPNGMGNAFHDLWVGAKGGHNRFRPHYYVWFESPEYASPLLPGEAETLRGTLSEEETRLRQHYGVTLNQIKWRREKQRDLRERFKQEYPEDDVSCFLASGTCCFDREALARMAARIAAEPVPEVVAVLTGAGGDPLAVAPAQLSVWKRPQADRLYVIGADVGEGLATGDASCACVLDRESGEQVAELHGRVPPDRFGHLLDALGRYYGLATLAVERNNHGHSTLNTLRNVCRYPRLYYHVRYDQMGKATPVLGWPTDQATKPILVDDLAAAITDGGLLVHSSGLVDECFTFVTTDSGAQEAQEGKHDDRVLAAGIAWQARKRGVSRGSSQRPAGW